MARRPNYDFEKRQKEMAKQKKKEEKEEKKRLRKEAIARGEIVPDEDELVGWTEDDEEPAAGGNG